MMVVGGGCLRASCIDYVHDKADFRSASGFVVLHTDSETAKQQRN